MRNAKKALFALSVITILTGCSTSGSSLSSSIEVISSSSESSISSSETSTSSSSSSTSIESSSSSSSISSESTKVASISLNYTTYNLPIRKLIKLQATVLPENAENKAVTWKSSDTATVSVDDKGECYGWKVGTAIITATAKDGSEAFASCEVTVYEVQPTSVTLDKHTYSLFPEETFTLNASILPTDVSNKTLTWESSDPTIASVTDKGVVEAHKQGVAIISVSATNGIKDTCEVTVTSIDVRNFALKKKSVSLHINGTYRLNPVFTPENATNKKVEYTSDNQSVASVLDGVITANAKGKATITATSLDGGLKSLCEVEVVDDEELTKTPIDKTYQDYSYNNLYGLSHTPSISNSKLLVVPVWLSDSSNYVSTAKKDTLRDKIETAFFGTSEETGWESVSSYYSKASFGKYELGGMVTDWYNCGLSSSYLGISSSNGSRIQTLASSCLNYVKDHYGLDDLSEYDQDGDGFIDGLIMIYAAPDYTHLNNTLDYLWAYTSWNVGSKKNLSDPSLNVYHWASYDFLFSNGTDASSVTGLSTYGSGDTSNCSIDAHTFIHETGHMLGLDDYYDYSANRYNPAGGFTMQDCNVGGQDPFSTMALGWADPYIPEKTTTITLKPFQESGDFVILSPEFNDCNSPFDEYLIAEYYTPTGLNQFDVNHKYSDEYPQGPNKGGVRLWHVDARLVYGSSYRDISASKMTCDPTTTLGKVYTAMSNTYYFSGEEDSSILGKNYCNYNLLQLIRKSNLEGYKPSNDLRADDLFVAGDTFNMSSFKSQFVNETKLNNGKDLGWSFYVDSIDENGLTITFTK